MILNILVTTILILYRKLYINIVSIIVLNIETRQYNININLAALRYFSNFDRLYFFVLLQVSEETVLPPYIYRISSIYI